MKDINEFSREVRDRLVQRYPLVFPQYRASIELVEKNNGVVLHGLTVIPDKDGATPVIYLEDEYERYLRGEDMDILCDEIRERYRKAVKDLDIEMGKVLDEDNLLNSLRVDLVDTDSNRELLEKLVCRDAGCGYSFTAFADLPADSHVDGRIRITKDLAESFGLTEQQLMEKAVRSAQKNAPAVLAYPDDIVDLPQWDRDTSMLDEPEADPEGFLVLTTKDRYMGAAALFYPGMKERISDAIGGQDYYVVPSSVHEVMIVPYMEETSPEKLAVMLRNVNMCLVSAEERLGERILKYSRDTKELTVAADLNKDIDLGMER